MKGLILSLLNSLLTEALMKKFFGEAVEAFFTWLEAQVANTENTIDDKVVAALRSALTPD